MTKLEIVLNTFDSYLRSAATLGERIATAQLRGDAHERELNSRRLSELVEESNGYLAHILKGHPRYE